MVLSNDAFREVISSVTGSPPSKISFQSSIGGSINDAGVLSFDGERVFVKWNSAHSFPGMFDAEAKGLDLLRKTNMILIPGVLGIIRKDAISILVLEYIERGSPGVDFFEKFGQQLAALHSCGSAEFGLDHRNYIGSLDQKNELHASWPEFFSEERLQPLVKKAVTSGLLGVKEAGMFDQLYEDLDHLFPPCKPSLLHGDLWSGNFMCDQNGEPVIYDPAVYYGNREMDIAMSRLFGGFDASFYSSYNEAFPLDKGWEERIDLCNLYPLLVHLNLFGRAYLPELLQILRRFVG